MAINSEEVNMLQHHLLPEVQISEIELGYIAGTLDAGGSFRVQKQTSGRTSYCMQVLYKNRRNLEVIKHMAELFEANLKVIKGGVTDIKEISDLDKMDWQFTLTSRKAYRLLKQIHPFLRIKRKQAELCMQFLEMYWRPHSTKPVEPERQMIGEKYAKKLEKLYMKSWPRRRVNNVGKR